MYASLKEDILIRLNPDGAELFGKITKPARLKVAAVEMIEMLNDGKDEEFISNEISKKYGETENTTKEMAREFLNQLQKRGYVSVGEEHSRKKSFMQEVKIAGFLWAFHSKSPALAI